MRHNHRMATVAAAAVMVSHYSNAATSTRMETEELMELLKRARQPSNNNQQQQRLTAIDLEHKNLPLAYLQRLLMTIAKHQKNHPHLTKLRLYNILQKQQQRSSCPIAPALGAFLHDNTTLVQLTLSKNRLGTEAVTRLIQELPSTRIRILHCDHCHLTGSQLAALLAALQQQQHVTYCKLGSNRFDNDTHTVAMTALATYLQDPTCVLTKLDLRATGIRPSPLFCQALASSPRLKSIGLAKNDWTNTDLQVFCELTLATATTKLETLDLDRHERLTCIDGLIDCLHTTNHRLKKVKLRQGSSSSIKMSDKHRLLQALLLNAHGHVLAAQTKNVERQILQQQHVADNQHDGCVICFEPFDTAGCLLPCTHQNCCTTCARQLGTCHMCRQVVVKVLPLEKKTLAKET